MKPFFILFLGLFLNSNYLFADPTPKSTPEKVASGAKVFAANCVACHGIAGAGDGPAAVAFNPKPRNLKTESFAAGDTAEKIFATVTNGLPKSQMLGFKQIKDSDRWDVTFYILSLRKNSK